jgi:hypothetical protein
MCVPLSTMAVSMTSGVSSSYPCSHHIGITIVKTDGADINLSISTNVVFKKVSVFKMLATASNSFSLIVQISVF